MAERTAGSIRARVRAEMVEEIKNIARGKLGEDGANLSLRAVARDMGMVSSAIYRYFTCRDELLTALILDAYNSMGEAAEAAGAAVRDREDYLGRWLAVAHAIRDWAVARPHEYALIYGSPVPGYAAPRDTVEPSIRPVVVLGAILDDAHAAGRLKTSHLLRPEPVLRTELGRVRDVVAPGISEAVTARGLIAWTELFGAISFELFGRFNNTITDLEAWFDHQARVMAAFLGLTG
ncbi:TetR/AcrR family transcriptional regulator [Actinophytocola sp.]|uniref:TetR/AcrR family transcriptional regulator n=1 Tax=Actinophytocola sp. TaxID=1872138 RepID=UPI003D6C36EA